jgi:hypothetical protein
MTTSNDRARDISADERAALFNCICDCFHDGAGNADMLRADACMQRLLANKLSMRELLKGHIVKVTTEETTTGYVLECTLVNFRTATRVRVEQNHNWTTRTSSR